jgi:hypothetical protein
MRSSIRKAPKSDTSLWGAANIAATKAALAMSKALGLKRDLKRRFSAAKNY